MRPLILASTSRYRAALFARLGLPFTLEAPGVEESALPGESAADLCVRLAEAKARAVAARHPDALVIGSDQLADCDGVHVGKPGSRERARDQLARLSGRTVVFHTGVALVDATSGSAHTERVDIVSTLRTLTPCEIDDYLAREAPFDCAGSVKSESLGIALFERIASDDPTALVGLPLIATCRLLRAAGVDVLGRRCAPSPGEGG